ncbi:D-hydantoinase, partial [Streptomyces azureus]
MGPCGGGTCVYPCPHLCERRGRGPFLGGHASDVFGGGGAAGAPGTALGRGHTASSVQGLLRVLRDCFAQRAGL